MSKLLCNSLANGANHLASRVRSAFACVRGGGGLPACPPPPPPPPARLLAAGLSFNAYDAAAQTLAANTFTNTDIGVQRTTFGENWGTPNPRTSFYIWSRSAAAGQRTDWTISLHNGTGQNAAMKGVDFGTLLPGENPSGQLFWNTTGD